MTALAILALRMAGTAQESIGGRKIYEQNSASVVLLFARDEAGSDVALGSGFWVEGKKLVTNAHVANAGKLVIEVGPVRIPCRLEKIDQTNDLAILTVDVEVTARGLQLAKELPRPGDVLYTITNPEGLEKTISQGVLAGIRTVGGRELLQITAPISHGSSGGPVFNSSGQVVGVAVGMLEEGQNLNFAVPTSALKTLLEGTTSPHTNQCIALLEQVQRLKDLDLEYSAAPDSEYQKREERMNSLLDSAFKEAGSDPQLQVLVSKAALTQQPSIAVKAARRAVDLRPNTDSYIALARALDMYAFFASDSNQSVSLSQAVDSATAASRLSKRPSAEVYEVLGEIRVDQGNYREAEQNYAKAFADSTNLSAADRASVIRGLVTSTSGLGDLTAATRWLNLLVAAGEVKGYDWEGQGDRLEKVSEYQEAAAAYEKAAQAGLYNNLCSAAWMQENANNDGVGGRAELHSADERVQGPREAVELCLHVDRRSPK